MTCSSDVTAGSCFRGIVVGSVAALRTPGNRRQIGTNLTTANFATSALIAGKKNHSHATKGRAKGGSQRSTGRAPGSRELIAEAEQRLVDGTVTTTTHNHCCFTFSVWSGECNLAFAPFSPCGTNAATVKTRRYQPALLCRATGRNMGRGLQSHEDGAFGPALSPETPCATLHCPRLFNYSNPQ
jgi:hypothetical protein